MNTVWLNVTSGEGPAECEWVVSQMVQRIQIEVGSAGIDINLLEATEGTFSGTLSSALLVLEGEAVKSFLLERTGVIRWVGRSPFRPTHKRKNWFIAVSPLTIEETPTWSATDIRIETMRSSGPGGQHVNKTESAVRVTHLPTGLTAVAREERSQTRNKSLALSRLAQLFENRVDAAEQKLHRDRWELHHQLERGNAILTYEGPEFRLRRPKTG